MIDTTRLPLTKPCTCSHTLNWHNAIGCSTAGCACTAFTAPRPADDDDETAALRDRIAQALEAADYSGKMRRGDLADAVMPVVTAALAWEVDAHSEHRRAVCEALGGNLVDWPETVRRVRKGIADRDGLRIELTNARAGDVPWVKAYAEDIAAAEDRAREARQLAENMQGRAQAVARGAREDNRRRREAEAALARVREIASRLAAHAAGFRDVLDATDHGPWARTVGADIEELSAALGDDQPAEAQQRPREQRPCHQLGCIGAHRYMLGARVYDCPGPTALRDQAAEPLLRGGAAAAFDQGAAIMRTAIREYIGVVAPAFTAAIRALGLTEYDDR